MSLPCCHISTGLAYIQFIGQPNHLLPQEIAASIPKTGEQRARRKKIRAPACISSFSSTEKGLLDDQSCLSGILCVRTLNGRQDPIGTLFRILR